jgi:hypothetical protein
VTVLVASVGASACGGSGEASEPTNSGRASVEDSTTTTIVDLGEPSSTTIEVTVPPTTDAPTTDAPTTLAPTTDAPTTTIVETPIAEYQEVATFAIATLEDRVKAFQYLNSGATATVNLDGTYTFDRTTPRYNDSADDLPEGLADAINGTNPAIAGIVVAYLKAGADAQLPLELVLLDQGAFFSTIATTTAEMTALSASVTDGSASALDSFATFGDSVAGSPVSAGVACATSFSFAADGAARVTRGILFVHVIDGDKVVQTSFTPYSAGVPDADSLLGVVC